ncbi:MAG TPA: exodeoxyribonuclease VII small subunit [Gemmatimonadaceae bacterium]|nr:exodeoxyribonuclease VII small subunit [Gemmatimonadaceae bacterium]
MSFEDDLARLDAIARALENDRLPLDDALKLFEEGVARLRSATQSLAAAEGRVQQLVEQADGTLTVKDRPK